MLYFLIILDLPGKNMKFPNDFICFSLPGSNPDPQFSSDPDPQHRYFLTCAEEGEDGEAGYNALRLQPDTHVIYFSYKIIISIFNSMLGPWKGQVKTSLIFLGAELLYESVGL